MHEIPTAENILSDPLTIFYTEDVNKALSPHAGVLHRLLTALDSSNPEISSKLIPAKKRLEDEGKVFENILIPPVGTISIMERAQITNWFKTHISRDKKFWLNLVPRTQGSSQ